MNAMTKLEAVVLVACINCAVPTNATAWWDDDDYDRWYDGPWYGGYPGYGGWGGYPGYGGWGGGYGQGPSTIVVNPTPDNSRQQAAPAPRLPE